MAFLFFQHRINIPSNTHPNPAEESPRSLNPWIFFLITKTFHPETMALFLKKTPLNSLKITLARRQRCRESSGTASGGRDL